MKTFIFFSFLIIITMLGCDNQADVTNIQNDHPSIDGLIPMKEGNYWVYLSSNYDSTGRQYPANLYTSKILKDTLINNEPWFIFSEGYIRTNRNDGMWFMSSDGPRLGYPLNLNDSVCTAPYPNICDYYIKLTKVNELIYVLGVKYYANVYDFIFPDFEVPVGYRNYIVPHLGIVRREIYGATPNEGTYKGPFLTYDLVYSNVQ